MREAKKIQPKLDFRKQKAGHTLFIDTGLSALIYQTTPHAVLP